MRQRLGQIAAWVITLAILAFVFSRVPLHEVLAALRLAAPWTIPTAFALVLVIYVADCFAMWKTFGWFAAPLAFREVLLVRGATYLLALVNYAVGQGGIVYFIHKSRGIPVARGAATVLLIMGINVLTLLALATVGLAATGNADVGVRTLVIAGYAGLAVYLILIKLRPGFLTRRPVLEVLFNAGLSGHLKAFVVRLPHIFALIVFNHAMLHALGVKIPFAQSVVYLPVVFLAAIVPSALGLGPAQASMIALISKWAPGDGPRQQATVLAAGLATWFLAVIIQICVSLICLRSQLARNLRREMPAPS